jgi:LysM repeat protein
MNATSIACHLQLLKSLLKNWNHMKKLVLSLFLFFTTISLFAQQELLIQSNNKGFYITHTVQTKENFYSIGRLYNLSPKDIAAYNSLDMNNGLNVGQQVMIPLTAANFTQTSTASFPVYYKVGEKEGLYRVSLKNNNVLMATLRKYNNLSSDAISVGQKLIVGYIKSSENGAVATHTPTTTTPPTTTTISTSPKTEPQAPKEEPKKVEAVVANEPPKETQVKQTAAPVQTAVRDANGGYFKTAFEQQSKSMNANKETTATASIFKTASGWQDTKYYALMDGVEPGTIVRVVNPSNSKAIYAKVLGGMSGIRQNAGLDVRISNAAANVLDITDTEKFVIKVNY